MPRALLLIFAGAFFLVALFVAAASMGASFGTGITLGVGTPAIALGSKGFDVPPWSLCAGLLAASGALVFLSVKARSAP